MRHYKKKDVETADVVLQTSPTEDEGSEEDRRKSGATDSLLFFHESSPQCCAAKHDDKTASLLNNSEPHTSSLTASNTSQFQTELITAQISKVALGSIPLHRTLACEQMSASSIDDHHSDASRSEAPGTSRLQPSTISCQPNSQSLQQQNTNHCNIFLL